MDLATLQKKFTHYSILREKGQIEAAIKGYSSLLPQAERYLFSQVPEMIGVAYRMAKQPRKGLAFAKQSVAWAIKAKDIEQEANCRRDLAGIYQDLKKFDLAETQLQKSLRLIWKISESKINAVAGTLSFLSKLSAHKKDFAATHPLATAATAMTYPSTLLSAPHSGQHYLFLYNHAKIYADQGNKQAAGVLARQALAGFTQLGQSHRVQLAKSLIAKLKQVDKPKL